MSEEENSENIEFDFSELNGKDFENIDFSSLDAFEKVEEKGEEKGETEIEKEI